MKNFTVVERLDQALSMLKKNGYSMNIDTLTEAFKGQSKDIQADEANRILLKLEKDGYVTKTHHGGNNFWFSINFDGFVFEEEGGYTAVILKTQAELALIQQEKDLLAADRFHNLAVADNMEKNAKRLNYLTFWLSIGSGILALIELIKFLVWIISPLTKS